MAVPSLLLDVVPLSLVLCLAISLASLGLALWRKGAPYLMLWGMGGVLIAGAILLQVLRESVPQELSIGVSNVSLIAGYVCLAAGVRALHGRSSAGLLPLGVVAAGAFISAWLGGAGVQVRIAIMALTLLTFSGLMLADYIGGLRRTPNPGLGRRIGVVALALNALVALMRLLVALGVPIGLTYAEVLRVSILSLAILAVVGIVATLVVLSAPLAQEALVETEGDAGPSPDPAPSPPGWRLAHEHRSLVTPDGNALRLTGNEFLVLQHLCAHVEVPVSRATLNGVLGREGDNPRDRSIDILISRLRRKCTELGTDLPVTAVRGQGYMFHGDLATRPGQ